VFLVTFSIGGQSTGGQMTSGQWPAFKASLIKSRTMDTIVSGVWGMIHNATSSYPIVQVRSKVDGLMYNVRDMPDKQAAADLLARVRNKLQRLISILRQRYPGKPQVIQLNEKFEADEMIQVIENYLDTKNLSDL
jgi:hypothetical protein